MVVTAGSIRRPVGGSASLRPRVRRPAVPETAEPIAAAAADSPSAAGNATEDSDDGPVDTGMEQEGAVTRPPDVERRVRREATRLRLRPPKSVRYSHGQWQVVDLGRQVYIYSAFYDDRPDIDWPQVGDLIVN